MTQSSKIWQVKSQRYLGVEHGAERAALLLSIEPDWDLEDAPQIAARLSERLNGRITEQIDGADRTSFRLLANNCPLILQFEFYSHACWLEAELDDDEEVLRSLL